MGSFETAPSRWVARGGGGCDDWDSCGLSLSQGVLVLAVFQGFPGSYRKPSEKHQKEETGGLWGAAGFSLTTAFITNAAVVAPCCHHALLVSSTPGCSSGNVALYTSSKDEWDGTLVVTDDVKMMRNLNGQLQRIFHGYRKLLKVNETALSLNINFVVI